MTGYPEVGTAKPAPVSAGGRQMQFNLCMVAYLFVADVNMDDNAVLRLRICGQRLAGPYSRSVSAASVASAIVVRNAGRRRGVGSDMTPTVATSKSELAREGFPSA